MTYGHPTTPDELLALFERRVSAACGLPPALVFTSLHPDDWLVRFPPADRFIALRPTAAQPYRGAAAGGGRLTAVFDSIVRVACFARLDRDREGRASAGLTDGGLTALLVKAVAALQMFEPVRPDAPAECLLVEPARAAGYSFAPKSAGDGSPWCVADSTWRLAYRLKLT